jgi:hypothetical protein
MKRKFVLVMFSLALIFGLLVPYVVSAGVLVGVKEGDWIEFNITYTGSPPNDYPQWVRVEIQNIQGTTITLEIVRELLNEKSDTKNLTFDLEVGAPNLIVIPANLDVDDEFYHEDAGNIEIFWTVDYDYAGAKRTVVAAQVSQSELHWDKSTGILVQADQFTVDFSQKWMADKTNMWQPKIFGLDLTIFYVLIAGVLTVIATAYILTRRRR